jgi:hypothetical protein
VTPCSNKGLSPTASVFQPFSGSPSVATRPIATALSTDLGVSRLLVAYSTIDVSVDEVQAWLTVGSLSYDFQPTD